MVRRSRTTYTEISDPNEREIATEDGDSRHGPCRDVRQDDPDGFSAAVNAVLRAEKQRRGRVEALTALVDELDEQFGPADPYEVEQAMSLLR